MDALALRGDEGRSSLRYAAGSWQPSFDPWISEWGNLSARIFITEYIGSESDTWGTEISKYPEEKKSTEISLVVTSEKEEVQWLSGNKLESSGNMSHSR